MTPEMLLEKLKTYETALRQIAKKIENQQAYETYLDSQGGGWSREKQDLRAVTYQKIVRIMNAMFKRHPDDATFVVLDPALLNFDDDD